MIQGRYTQRGYVYDRLRCLQQFVEALGYTFFSGVLRDS